jgi:predicted DNA-binding protein (UPF0251 family)
MKIKKGRPIKPRNVRRIPQVTQFSPRGRPGRPDEVIIKLEEFEAIKLADFIGLSQKKASILMGISQQTFSRILKKARKNLATGLVLGKIIKIQGGSYRLSNINNNSGIITNKSLK